VALNGRGYVCECPWALAILRAARAKFRRWDQIGVVVGTTGIVLKEFRATSTRSSYLAKVPGDVVLYINRFDDGAWVPDNLTEVFSFEL
jgi:hypothetical protein